MSLNWASRWEFSTTILAVTPAANEPEPSVLIL